MDFRGWIPPELIIGAVIIVVLSACLAAFVAHDWLVPFLVHHISVH